MKAKKQVPKKPASKAKSDAATFFQEMYRSGFAADLDRVLSARKEIAETAMRSAHATEKLKTYACEILGHLRRLDEYIKVGDIKAAVYTGMQIERATTYAVTIVKSKIGGHSQNSKDKILDALSKINPNREGNFGIIKKDAEEVQRQLEEQLKKNERLPSLTTIHRHIADTYPAKARRPGAARKRIR